MRIKFPKKIRSNFEGYNSFIELLRLLQESSDTDFTISFENTKVFEANLSAILGAIIDSTIELQKKVEYVVNILDKVYNDSGVKCTIKKRD